MGRALHAAFAGVPGLQDLDELHSIAQAQNTPDVDHLKTMFPMCTDNSS